MRTQSQSQSWIRKPIRRSHPIVTKTNEAPLSGDRQTNHTDMEKAPPAAHGATNNKSTTHLSEKPTSDSRTITSIISKDLTPESVDNIIDFFTDTAIYGCSQKYNSDDFYSDLISDLLKPNLVERGRVSCVASVHPAVTNGYNGLHGGAVAAIAERLAIACARTVVAQDKQLFLGELSVSYLSAAPQNELLVVDGSVARSGRNLTVVGIEFKVEKTGKLAYLARATLYHIPAAKL